MPRCVFTVIATEDKSWAIQSITNNFNTRAAIPPSPKALGFLAVDKMRLFIALILLTKVFHTDEEWREKLGSERYRVMREKGTERGFLGKYVYCEEPGIYLCAACEQPLFDSKDKYESGAGWPSFRQPVASKNVYYLKDGIFKRYEVLCSQCDSHLGHVFNDGPPPKGFRYCINSIALVLEPAKEQSRAPFVLGSLP